MAIFSAAFMLFFGLATWMSFAQGSPLGWAFLAFAATGAFVFIVGVKPIRMIFDAPSRTAEIIASNLLGRKRVTYALCPNTVMELEEQKSSKGMPVSRLVLVVKGGQSAGRFPFGIPEGGENNKQCQEVVNAWLKDVL